MAFLKDAFSQFVFLFYLFQMIEANEVGEHWLVTKKLSVLVKQRREAMLVEAPRTGLKLRVPSSVICTSVLYLVG